MRDQIKRYALDNAIQYNGKANPSAVVGKVFSAFPDKKGPETIKLIQEVCNEVNKLSLDEQKKELDRLGHIEKKEKSNEFVLPELAKANGPITVRLAPNPSGHLHIGHARQGILNWLYHQKYGGEYLLRYDDTDPKNKVPLKEVYKEGIKDLAWLGIKPTKTVIQSKRLSTYYKYGTMFVNKGKAYVCRCETESKRESLSKKQTCPCREESLKVQKKEWKKFLKEYKEGQAVLRIKTDLDHKNPAVRDWPAFRIVDNPQHPLVKNKHVWPLLNFASAIDDFEFKVTHIIRGIDLQVSDERQIYVYNVLGREYPVTIYTGKMNYEGIKSKSAAKAMITSGELEGWDDIRLGTLRALRRRGILPETIIHFMKDAGLTRSEVTISQEKLGAFNRQLIDKKVDRYFFIPNPKKITIAKSPKVVAEVPLHPDLPERGTRTLKGKGTFLVGDELLPDKMYRLIHGFNFKDLTFVSKDQDSSLKAQLIQWLPDNNKNIPVEILMIDGTVMTGLAEPLVKKLKEGDMVQFVRIGFCRLDKKSKDKLTFWMSHE